MLCQSESESDDDSGSDSIDEDLDENETNSDGNDEVAVKGMSQLRRYCCELTRAKAFNNVIYAVIGMNIVTAVLESRRPNFKWTWRMIDQCSLGIYVTEMLLRLIADRWKYFNSVMNKMDFVIIVFSAIDLLRMLLPLTYYLKLFRTVRFFKLIKLFKMIETGDGSGPTNALLKTMYSSVRECVAAVFLMLCIMYVYAYIGFCYYREVSPESFGDITRSFFSLFHLCTFDNWFAMYDAVKVVPEGHIAFFISFMLLCSFIILNYITAILTDSACEAAVHTSRLARLREDRKRSNGEERQSSEQKLCFSNPPKSAEVLLAVSEIDKGERISAGTASVLHMLLVEAIEDDFANM